MNRPSTLFDVPQFALVADDRPRSYANVVNDMVIEQEGGDRGHDAPKTYYVVVPTALFTLMKDTLKVDPHDAAFMYLIRQEGSEYFIFGLAWGEEDFTDLWTYTDSSLPPCFR